MTQKDKATIHIKDEYCAGQNCDCGYSLKATTKKINSGEGCVKHQQPYNSFEEQCPVCFKNIIQSNDALLEACKDAREWLGSAMLNDGDNLAKLQTILDIAIHKATK